VHWFVGLPAISPIFLSTTVDHVGTRNVDCCLQGQLQLLVPTSFLSGVERHQQYSAALDFSSCDRSTTSEAVDRCVVGYMPVQSMAVVACWLSVACCVAFCYLATALESMSFRTKACCDTLVEPHTGLFYSPQLSWPILSWFQLSFRRVRSTEGTLDYTLSN
jgi:hypothetical protein